MKNYKMLIGLGNPISKYNGTRHNIGSQCIQWIANYYSVKLKLKKKLVI
ncbi:hypothetical protein [Buchnera aphidicola]